MTTIDGGWYRVDVLDVREEDGRLVVQLDESTLWVDRRQWGYWRALLRTPFQWLRDLIR